MIRTATMITALNAEVDALRDKISSLENANALLHGLVSSRDETIERLRAAPSYSFELPDGSIGHDAPQAAAAWMREAKRLRATLKPFASAYDCMERNGHVVGYQLIARQKGEILGHAGFGVDELRAARDAIALEQEVKK